MLKKCFNYYAKNLYGASKEAYEIVQSYPQRFKEKNTFGKILSVGKVAAVPLSIYLTSGTTLSTAAIIGAATLSMVMLMLRMKNNKHKNAMGAPIAYANMAQKLLLGGTGYAIMAGIAGTRGLVMAALPDTKESERLRNRVGFAFAATGIGLIGVVAHQKQELWELLPMASMLLGTLASTKINDKSYQARVCHVIANTNNFIYSMLYSGAAGPAMIDATGASLAATTIAENDIPKQKRTGERLSLSKRATAYFQTVINSEKRNDFLYKEMPTTVLNLRRKPKLSLNCC